MDEELSAAIADMLESAKQTRLASDAQSRALIDAINGMNRQQQPQAIVVPQTNGDRGMLEALTTALSQLQIPAPQVTVMPEQEKEAKTFEVHFGRDELGRMTSPLTIKVLT